MRGEVVIDSGAFIAFLVRRDRLHARTVKLFDAPPPRWSTSVLVVAETYGWFSHRLGEEDARTFRAFLDKLPGSKFSTQTKIIDERSGTSSIACEV